MTLAMGLNFAGDSAGQKVSVFRAEVNRVYAAVMNPRLRALAPTRGWPVVLRRSGMFVFAAVILGNAVNYAYLLLLGRLLSILDYGVVISLVSAVLLCERRRIRRTDGDCKAGRRSSARCGRCRRMSAFLLVSTALRLS